MWRGETDGLSTLKAWGGAGAVAWKSRQHSPYSACLPEQLPRVGNGPREAGMHLGEGAGPVGGTRVHRAGTLSVGALAKELALPPRLPFLACSVEMLLRPSRAPKKEPRAGTVLLTSPFTWGG